MYKQVLENATRADNFGINNCLGIEPALSEEARVSLERVKSVLKAADEKYIRQCVVRNSFFIEPVNQDITSTKFQTRWTDWLSSEDPRFASYEECCQIASKLYVSLANMSDDDLKAVAKFRIYKKVAYELPIDYIDRYAQRLHSAENIHLEFSGTAKRVLRLREILHSAELNPDHEIFDEILKGKIKTKTYLTDRAQTGLYRTNREKRWEAHPKSVQYALRFECMKIEMALILQAAQFEGANPVLVRALQNEDYLKDHFDYWKCPITGEVLQYSELVNDVLHPRHGLSPFQVGHLNPLKKVNSGEVFGHSADNISWISEDGNRIQGSLSMEEVDRLLVRIYINRNFRERIDIYEIKSIRS